MAKGNAIVGQSGGPTSVINSSLAGIVQGCGEVADIRPRARHAMGHRRLHGRPARGSVGPVG